jgi:hypothetical protein
MIIHHKGNKQEVWWWLQFRDEVSTPQHYHYHHYMQEWIPTFTTRVQLDAIQLHDFTNLFHFLLISGMISVLLLNTVILKQTHNQRMVSNFPDQNTLRCISTARFYKPLPFLLLQWHDFCPVVEDCESKTQTREKCFLIFLITVQSNAFQLQDFTNLFHFFSFSDMISVLLLKAVSLKHKQEKNVF